MKKKYSFDSRSVKNKSYESNVELLRIMTYNNKDSYEGTEKCLVKNPDEELCLYQFLCPKEVINRKRVLMGYKGDGSYVMLDDFDNNTIAYSIGINKEIKFDKALADKGIDVFMYEYKIEHLTRAHQI